MKPLYRIYFDDIGIPNYPPLPTIAPLNYQARYMCLKESSFYRYRHDRFQDRLIETFLTLI